MGRGTDYEAVIACPVLGADVRLGIHIRDDRLTAIDYTTKPLLAPSTELSRKVARQLLHYSEDPFYGFTLPLSFSGTPFQVRVWQALMRIPPGEVRSYGQLATELQTGPRAVGNACRHNPIPIVVPCHRIVASNGPGGYSGKTGGQELVIKKQLLHHERQAENS